LVLVAIARLPFLLGDSEEPLPPPSSSGGGGAQASGVGGTLTVVEAEPGLRDYKKRLRARTPSDPFEQRYTGLPNDAKLESTVATTPTGEGDDSSEVSVTDEGDTVTVEVDEDAGSTGSGVATRETAAAPPATPAARVTPSPTMSASTRIGPTCGSALPGRRS
jgi:hypothetical protein